MQVRITHATEKPRTSRALSFAVVALLLVVAAGLLLWRPWTSRFGSAQAGAAVERVRQAPPGPAFSPRMIPGRVQPRKR